MREKYDAYEAVYRRAPGIGALIARVLSNELGDMRERSFATPSLRHQSIQAKTTSTAVVFLGKATLVCAT